MSGSNSLPTFPHNLSVSSSRVEKTKYSVTPYSSRRCIIQYNTFQCKEGFSVASGLWRGSIFSARITITYLFTTYHIYIYRLFKNVLRDYKNLL